MNDTFFHAHSFRKVFAIFNICCIGLGAIAGAFIESPALAASLLPLDTEEARVLPHAKAEAVLGLSYTRNQLFPTFTSKGNLDSQNLFQVPQVAFRIGAGDWAEIQASFEAIYLDEKYRNGGGNDVFGTGDARLFAKIRLLDESDTLPALATRFGAKLPNADVKDRLGTDQTDFEIAVLGTKDFGRLSAHLNLGILLLGNPGQTLSGGNTSAGGQDDLFTWNLAMESNSLISSMPNLRLLGEFSGWSGTRFANDRATFRIGAQYSSGNLNYYLGSSFGLISESEDIGIRAGLIYSFEPATLWESLFGSGR